MRARPAPTLAPLSMLRAWGVAGLAALVLSVAVEPVGASASVPAARFTVGTEAPVTAGLVDDAPAQNSPVVAADPTDERFVVVANRLDAPDYSCALQLSGDGGRGWVGADPVPTLPKGAEKCYAPDVAFDRTGLLYYLFVGLAGLGNAPMGIFLTTSRDRGRTFSPPHRILAGETKGPRFGVRMAIDRTVGDRGRMHVVWLQANAQPSLGGLPPSTTNPILAVHSDDGGRTFSAPVQVSDPRRKRVVAPALTVGPDRAVHVAYYDLEDDVRDYQGLEGPRWEGTWSIVVASSPDGGKSFGESRLVADGIVPIERVMLIFTMPPATIAADRAGGVYVAWPDARHGDWDVLLSRSQDGGRRWSDPTRMNDDPVGNGRHQYLPVVATAPGGRLDAVFADRRNSGDNTRNDTYFTSSSDGGRTFAPNLRLTSESSNARIGPGYLVPSALGLKEYGARFGLVSRDAHAVAAWTDTRNAGGGVTNQEIFAVRVGVTGGPVADADGGGSGGRVVRAAAALAAAVLVAALALLRRRRAGRAAVEED